MWTQWKAPKMSLCYCENSFDFENVQSQAWEHRGAQTADWEPLPLTKLWEGYIIKYCRKGKQKQAKTLPEATKMSRWISQQGLQGQSCQEKF